MSGTNQINPCVQVEDVRKVLYHFAIFVIINDKRERHCAARA